ncbi:MAG: PAS domain-containing protein [Oscillatoriales cyanobacterium C42_A2020_001]|nr:PAS domain-containing protein [Leptolyngbyaceae cyanobacterium C42_A2020_001]
MHPSQKNGSTRGAMEANGFISNEVLHQQRNRVDAGQHSPGIPVDPAAPRAQQIYETLVNSIDGIVWEADATTFQFTFVSPQAERLLGYPIEQWLEPNFWINHVYPADLDNAVRTCQAATQAHRNHEFEYRMVAADGRLVWLKDVVTVVVENSQPRFLRGVMIDVTRQKNIEAGLIKQQIQIEMAMEVARMGTWDWDLLRDTIQYSKNVGQIFGFPTSHHSSPRQSFLDAIHPEDRDQVHSAIQRSLNEDAPYNVEFRVLQADEQRWVNSRGSVFRDNGGNAVRMIGVLVDITERKQAEETLRQSHNFLQTVLDHLPVAVRVKDGREENFGAYTFWNKTCEELFGLTAEQAIGKTAYDCFSQEQANLLDQSDRETFKRGIIRDVMEAPHLSSSSAERLLHTVNVPIFDEQHNPQYLLSISEDVTQQKQAEESLRQRTEREALVAAITNNIRQSLDLKQILNTTVAQVRQFLQTDRVLIFRFRPSWSGMVLVESLEAGWESILGKVFHDPCFSDSFVELYGQGRIRAIPDTLTAHLPECYLNLLQTLQARAVLVVPIKQQERLWGLLIAHHCRGPRLWQSFEIDLVEQLAGQVGIAIEQSELYQQVQRLNSDLERQVQIRTAELQLASEFEATLKRITDRVRDSLDEDQILQTAVRELAIAIGVTGCNAALYDLENRTSKVSYEYTDSLVPLQGRVVQMDNFPEGYRQLIQGQHFQFCSLVPNPLRGYVAMLACPILDDQGVLGDLWLVTQKYRAFNDQDIRLVQQVANHCAIAIRQARLYQKAQAQVKELEKLNRLKDDFLSTVSHELRTPMSNIKMATQMLEVMLFNTKTQAEQNGNPRLEPSSQSASMQKAVRYFQILKDECQREINLINDLLDLSRLETGIDVPTLETIDLTGWIQQLVQPFMERARNQQQQLRLEVSLLPPITTDPSRLERIVGELLNNACKYTPAGESITVSAALIPNSTPLQSLHQTALEIVIANSGVEILPDELTRIFDKFYRIPNNDPWKHGGTGLGLALVKKLLEPLNGTIQATSENGSTYFRIQLPLTNSDGSHRNSSTNLRRV